MRGQGQTKRGGKVDILAVSGPVPVLKARNSATGIGYYLDFIAWFIWD